MDNNKDINIDFNQFNEILNYFKNKEYKFINNTLSNDIRTAIQILFPNLNKQDYDILFFFTQNIIEKISNYNDFDKDDKYYKQWTQNEYRDIKGIVMILLPFIDDGNNGILLNSMIDLNQFLYGHLQSTIPDLSSKNRTDILKSDFKFSNMSLGLLNKTSKTDLLKLYEKDGKMKLIYKIIHHNYLGLIRTLQIMNGKYYQNWINIVPILYKDSCNKELQDDLSFKKSKLYEKTEEGLKKLKEKNILSDTDEYCNFIKDYYGLYLGDIYNTIKIKMYDEIKHIKWLIFPQQSKDGNIYIIQHLGKKINFNMFFKYSNYEIVNIDDKNKFNKFIENTSKILQKEDIEMWKQILLFLTNNYSKKLIVKSEFLKEKKSKIFDKFCLEIIDFDNFDSVDDDEYIEPVAEKIINIKSYDVIEYLLIINVKHIWDFLYETIVLFNNTYLRDYFIEENKITKEKEIIVITNANNKYYYPGTKLSFKNIYNIAKSITHYNDDNNTWTSYDSHSISFPIEQEIEFLKKFLDDNSTEWLNLTYNLEKEFNIIDDEKYKKKMEEINKNWNEIKLDLVFEILTKNGILSEFEVALDITDENNYDSSRSSRDQTLKKMGKRMDNNKKWKNAYYYLTNNKYENLEKILLEDNKTHVKKDYDYFDLFSKNQVWYSFYAMDWLSQINFFHHYIHHRVLYVTGATGTGKSTQVPKLLMYALKAYEMKNNGKVVCTQPRITPTKSNAERISEELGVPIVRSLKKSQDKEKTDNFYVQMKYSTDYHLKNNCSHTTLKILTDGTLYEELQSNPMMKEQIYDSGKKEFIYGYKNHYDIIILDESHEHNTNMDMILTLTRQSCLYNNSLRLIIVSATMSDDEPIYRSYFRCINDDLVYPIKAPMYEHPILTDLFDSNTCVPDTIYMDRRFHISPPGKTTQYIVSEIYNNNVQINGLTDKEISELTQEESYKTILQICQKYPKGDILLFLTGSREINEAVEYLNQILPQGDIAIPFYADLHDKYKDIIADINIKISTIKNKRERIHIEWNENYIEDPNIPNNKYKRAIIIATNVAEASITIDSLKFIVDTGYSKVNLFNNDYGLTQLHIEPIAEASRIQRKGRIGRVSDGIAYFVYSKGSREKIKPKYKITQEDNTNMYFKLLKTSSIDEDEDDDVIPKQFDPNNYFYISNKIQEEIQDKKNVLNILKKQYSIKNKIVDKNLYWNKQYYPKSIITNNCLKRKYSGQEITSLADDKGEFYIIHPKENLIVRNINNEIIYYNKSKLNSIPHNVFSNEMEISHQKLIVIDTNYSSNIFNNDNKHNFVKTEIYNKVYDLKKVLNDNSLDENDCLTIFAAIGFDCKYEVLSILILIKTLNGSISELINDNKLHKFNNIWYSNIGSKSEIFILNNICEKLKSDNINLYIFKIMDNPKILKEKNIEIEKQIKDFKKKYNLKLTVDNNDDIDNWNLMKKLFNSGKLENKSGKEILRDDILIKQIEKDLDLNNLKIKLWCENYFIKYEHIKKYFSTLSKLIINLLTIEKNIDDEYGEISPLLWVDNIKHNFLKVLKTNNIKEKIIKSFILGRPLNYGIKLDFKNDYYNLYSPGLKGYLNINKLLPVYFSNIIFYYNYVDIKGKLNLNLVNDIDIDYFTSCLPHIFNKKKFNKIIPTIKYEYKKDCILEHKSFIQINGSNYDQIVCFINNNSMGLSPWENDEMPKISTFFKKLRI